eukprot:5349486-Lingulodinium_polyedra.AAC.1
MRSRTVLMRGRPPAHLGRRRRGGRTRAREQRATPPCGGRITGAPEGRGTRDGAHAGRLPALADPHLPEEMPRRALGSHGWPSH